MPLSPVLPCHINFTGYDQQPKSGRDKVEDAAAVTGGVGAGVAATRGNGAFKYFKSSEKLRGVVNTATNTSKAIAEPAKQSKSLWNALKLNYVNLKKGIADWAKASKMPKFMKAMFTGKLGKVISGGAAVFVFISVIGICVSLISLQTEFSERASKSSDSPFL